MKSCWGLAGLVALLAIGLNSCTSSNGTNPNGGTGFMWVTTQGDQMVSSYNINLTSGATSQVGSAVATGAGPVAIALTPAADALFVANRDDNTISAYGVNSDGSLKAQGTPVNAGELPVAMAIDPSGKLLFVANQGDFADPTSGTISVFNIQSGALTPAAAPAAAITSIGLSNNVVTAIAAQTTPAFTSGEIVTLTGLTTSTYLNNQSAVIVTTTALATTPPTTRFTFNFTHADDLLHAEGGTAAPTGSFLSQSPSNTTGAGPAAVLVSPTGSFLYVANQFNSTLSIFSYDTNGFLTPNPTSPVTAGTNPAGLAFSRCAGTTQVSTNCPTAAPPGYLFVANSGSNNISIFSACIQVTTTCPSADGTLSQIGSSPVGAGTRPVSFMVSPARDLVYAVDNGSFQVSEYKYSSATGALSTQSPTAISTGSSPLTGSITQDGNWVFVPNNGGSNLSGFGVSTSGALSVGTSISLAGQPSAVLIR